MFSIIQRSTNFYNEFYVQLLCEFSIISYYDKMNCNLVFGDVFQNVDFSYM
jgi:hypothetical protein